MHLPVRIQVQTNINANTFRNPTKFASPNFQWLREINLSNISAKLFVDLNAEYAESIRAQFNGELEKLKNTKRAISIFGQDPDTILKVIVIELNEYSQLLYALRAFLTRYRHPDRLIETPLHFIFCHLFDIQSDFHKLRTTEGKRGVSHEIYFWFD